MTNSGGFISAALHSLCQHINCVYKHNPGYLNDESINNFLQDNCNSFVLSLGLSIYKNERVSEANFKRFKKVLNRFRDKYLYLKNINYIIDSAGYQFQLGYMDKNDTHSWIDLYHKFLLEDQNLYEKAFLFDPIPGALDCVLDNYDEMENFNVESYSKSVALPKNVRDNLIYIHHFRTPMMNKLYKKLLQEYNFADHFDNFSTGGLVSFNHTKFPVIMYVIPLIYLINHTKRRKKTKLNFHILGGADYKDILFNRLVEVHVKNKHGIELNITYDSSGIFKTLMISRYMGILDEEKKLWRMGLKSDELDIKFGNTSMTTEEYFFKLTEDLSNQYDFKKLNKIDEPLYVDGSINRIHSVYGMFLILKNLKDISIISKEFAEELYNFYKNEEETLFNRRVHEIITNFNFGSSTHRVDYRASSFYSSLKALENLDENYCDYLVSSFFSGDECVKFTRKTETITF